MYMVSSGSHYNNGCCFDYGNAETNNDDNGDGHMDATFVTALLKNNGQNRFELKAANAQSGGLTTDYAGSEPSSYSPMHQEGAIVLGTGGDDSNSSAGSFFEGVMTSGMPTDAADNAVQANIVAAGYQAAATPFTPGSDVSIQAATPCCTQDYIQHDSGDNKVIIAQVDSASSSTAKADATWIVEPGLANSACISLESASDSGQHLRHYDFELYLETDDGTEQFAEDATFCPQPGNSGEGYSFKSVNYPNKYIRHYDYTVHLASDGGSNPWDTSTLWTEDSTWLAASPWS
jgi:hypothetical protein